MQTCPQYRITQDYWMSVPLTSASKARVHDRYVNRLDDTFATEKPKITNSAMDYRA